MHRDPFTAFIGAAAVGVLIGAAIVLVLDLLFPLARALLTG